MQVRTRMLERRAKLGERGQARGQVFAVDFIIAVLALTVALGVALHSYEFSIRSASRLLEFSANDASTIAEALANNAPASPSVQYCVQYSNGTGNCGAFACDGSTHVSRRLVECSSAPGFCSLEVRTCGG